MTPRHLMVVYLIFSQITMTLMAPVARADISNTLTLSKELQVGGRGNEYVSGDYPGAVLMKVNLWGAVNKTGIHYVPAKTDLMTLLSYAGGPTERAELDDVKIKRVVNGKEQAFNVDIEDLINGKGEKSPQLEANDIVVIPSKTQLISNDTFMAATFLATIMSIAVTGYLLQNNLKKK